MDASKIILGFTGSIGSGCTFISKEIPKIATNEQYKYYKLSDIIRDFLKEEDIPNPTVTQMQDKGNELREKNGGGFLVKKLLKGVEIDI